MKVILTGSVDMTSRDMIDILSPKACAKMSFEMRVLGFVFYNRPLKRLENITSVA